MKRSGRFLRHAATAAACVAVTACGRSTTSAKPANPVERGKYLVSVIGCNDCHTPKVMGRNGPEPDLTRELSGHPEQVNTTEAPPLSAAWAVAANPDLTTWRGPWGQSFAANLTPDQNTGLGIWTEDMFVKALRTGKHMGVSRPILPPMPWESFKNMSDADLKAIYAYLRTIKPVVNHVPDPIPAAIARR